MLALTDAQRQRIEENRARAREKLLQRQQQQGVSAGEGARPQEQSRISQEEPESLTKRKARELGLLAPRIKRASHATVEWVVVLDFEATCWASEAEKRGHTQEIIEFPAVLVSLARRAVVAEFHSYVRPTVDRDLSAFCRQLTGISQDTIDESPTLAVVLPRFVTWVEQQQRMHKFILGGPDATVLFATWTSWDLGVCLPTECRWRGLPTPPWLNTWADLKTLFHRHYQSADGEKKEVCGLAEALKRLGLQFEGREHSGIEDARNTAMLVCRMVSDRAPLRATTTLKAKRKEPPVAAEAAVYPVAKNPRVTAQSTPPFCYCLRRARLKTVTKPTPNIGRQFFSCVSGNCAFFVWCE
eukprot:m.233252 g.233252  ORF g.233252 m.233252 type:complete len:356 (+) comp19037_c0_seq1:52-1119(+)